MKHCCHLEAVSLCLHCGTFNLPVCYSLIHWLCFLQINYWERAEWVSEQLQQVSAKDLARYGNGFKAQCLIEPCSQQKRSEGRTVQSEHLQEERGWVVRCSAGVHFYNPRSKGRTEFQSGLMSMLFVQFLTLVLVLWKSTTLDPTNLQSKQKKTAMPGMLHFLKSDFSLPPVWWKCPFKKS